MRREPALDVILEWSEESCSDVLPELLCLVRSHIPMDLSNTSIYSDGHEYDLLLHVPVREEEINF